MRKNLDIKIRNCLTKKTGSFFKTHTLHTKWKKKTKLFASVNTILGQFARLHFI